MIQNHLILQPIIVCDYREMDCLYSRSFSISPK
jgi:hypothetical protein